MGTLEPIKNMAHLQALKKFWKEDCWDKERIHDSCTACPYYSGNECNHPKRPHPDDFPIVKAIDDSSLNRLQEEYEGVNDD